MKKNRRNTLSESNFKKYLSKRMRKTPGSNKKGAMKKIKGVGRISKGVSPERINLNNLSNKLRKSKPKESKLKVEKNYLLEELEYEKNNPVDPEFLNHQIHKFLKKI